MRYIFSIWIFFAVLGAADPARADMLRTCVFVETLAGLPGELRKVREGRGDLGEFRKNLADSARKLNDRRRVAVFSNFERRAMQTYLDAVREDWHTNGLSTTGRQIPGVTTITAQNRSTVIVIAGKFGCNLPFQKDDVPLTSVDGLTIDPLTLLAALAALLAVIFAIMKLMKYGHRDQRMICRVPAWLGFAGNKYATQIMNISRGGVMVQVPEPDISDAEVTLELASINITSRVVWTNSNFAGLVFEKKISMQMVEEIASQRSATSPKNDDAEAVIPSQIPGSRSGSPGISASAG